MEMKQASLSINNFMTDPNKICYKFVSILDKLFQAAVYSTSLNRRCQYYPGRPAVKNH